MGRTGIIRGSILAFVALVSVQVLLRGEVRADTTRPSVSEMLLDWMKMGSEEWLRRAEEEYRHGNLREAVKAAEEAVRLTPGSAYTHRLLGYLYATLGQNREARAEFERAAIIDPKLRVTLADFYLAQAWAELEAQLRREPNDPEIARRLGTVAALAELNPELKNLLRRQEDLPREAGATEMLPPVLLSEAAPYALVVEKRSQTARLYRWTRSGVTLERTYPVTTGQVSGEKLRRGDMRTPDGVYSVQDLIPGDSLPEIYGAFALPLNYPNAWDRLRGRDGHGIWIHGSDRLTQPFRPRETRGCVVMREEDLLHFVSVVSPQLTPIVISEVVPYKAAREWEQFFSPLTNREDSNGHLAAAALGPDYVAAIALDGEQVVRTYYSRDTSWSLLAREREPALELEAWNEKIAAVLPREVGSLEKIEIDQNSTLPRLVIHTSFPARPRAFRQESADRFYLDLPGVKPGPVPKTMKGDGAWIRQVKVGESHADPPVTRVVVDLYQPTGYRVTTRGKETVVSLVRP